MGSERPRSEPMADDVHQPTGTGEEQEDAAPLDLQDAVDERTYALATRNHGLPLEALRYDVTPPGLHYVLTHDGAPWTLGVAGRVARPLHLDVAALRARPEVTTRVTLERAGNGCGPC
jgi:hypothetical protein